jgi:hypothetical protein
MLSALGLACVLQFPVSSCPSCGTGGTGFPLPHYRRTHHGPPLSQRWALASKPDYWAPWFPSGYCCTLGTVPPNGDYYSFLMAQRYTTPAAPAAGTAVPAPPPASPANATEPPPPPDPTDEPEPTAPAVPTTNGEPPR